MSSRSAQSSGWIWSAEHGDYYRTTIEADGSVTYHWSRADNQSGRGASSSSLQGAAHRSTDLSHRTSGAKSGATPLQDEEYEPRAQISGYIYPTAGNAPQRIDARNDDGKGIAGCKPSIIVRGPVVTGPSVPGQYTQASDNRQASQRQYADVSPQQSQGNTFSSVTPPTQTYSSSASTQNITDGRQPRSLPQMQLQPSQYSQYGSSPYDRQPLTSPQFPSSQQTQSRPPQGSRYGSSPYDPQPPSSPQYRYR